VWQLKRLDRPGDANLRGRVQSALMTDEAMLWGMRARRLRRLRRELEEPGGEDPSGERDE